MKKFKYLVAFAIMVSIISTGLTAYAQPGTPEDPLVSRAYVNSRIAELEAQIAQLEALIAQLTLTAGAVDTLPSPPPFVPEYAPIPPPEVTTARELFQVVRAEAGTILVAGASTEIILRAGVATVVAGPNGLANVTAGHDVMNGESVQLNHLLISPQADGRGLRIHTTAYLMVKGDYFIVNEG